MKLRYFPDTDSLYIELRDAPSAETREIAADLNVDLDDDGAVIGFDIDHAAARFDLAAVEAVGLPLAGDR